MFKKYQKLLAVDYSYMEEYKEEPAHVLEKVEGVDYQCSYDGSGFDFGGLDKQLGAKEDYHGDLTIRSIFATRVKHLYTLIKEATLAQEKAAIDARDVLIEQGKPEEATKLYEDVKPDVSPTFKSLRVRGVLYGGGYDHPDVSKLESMTQICWYAPYYAQNISIAVFAVEIDDVPLPWLNAKVLCFSSDLPTVPSLFNGSFEECLKWSRENLVAPTLIPKGTVWLDTEGEALLDNEGHPQALPRIRGNNMAGHVIQFQEPKFLENGDMVIFQR